MIQRMDYLYTLLKFVVGGSVIVGVTLLAEHADPKYGGMLAAAPIITTIAFLFTYSEAGRETTRQLVISAFWFAIPTLLFLLAFWYLMYRFSILISIGGAYGIWIGALLVMNRILTGA
ncbi:MAG: GlpM family protein [Methanoregula sp.]|jgi:membrane protein GlpM|uniref:GlpM family protein n=1 Tax=Methanoregula sp. TaxID=2052170 RepID=UPI003D0B72A3